MEWRVVKNFNDYAVSDTGLVMRMGHIQYSSLNGAFYVEEHLMKPCKTMWGYLSVCLTTNSKSRHVPIHRLVAQAFIQNPYNKPQVNHIDGDKTNNNVENLEWCTPKENVQHAWNNGLAKQLGTHHRCAKLTEEQVRDIREHCVKGKRGVSCSDFGRKYGVAANNIGAVLDGKSYRNIF